MELKMRIETVSGKQNISKILKGYQKNREEIENIIKKMGKNDPKDFQKTIKHWSEVLSKTHEHFEKSKSKPDSKIFVDFYDFDGVKFNKTNKN